MDLRDRFAVHIAATLVGALTDPEVVARRAYDLAEAMLAERGRRIDIEEQHAIATEPGSAPYESRPIEHHAALLDEPAPLYDDEDDEPPYDPTWDLEPTVAPNAGQPRPGLARTQPEATGECGGLGAEPGLASGAPIVRERSA